MRLVWHKLRCTYAHTHTNAHNKKTRTYSCAADAGVPEIKQLTEGDGHAEPHAKAPVEPHCDAPAEPHASAPAARDPNAPAPVSNMLKDFRKFKYGLVSEVESLTLGHL